MNEFSITPFRGPHLLLLLLTATAVLLIFLLLRGKPEARRSRLLIGVCFYYEDENTAAQRVCSVPLYALYIV